MLASENATRMNPASYATGSPAVEALLSAMDVLLGGPWDPEPEKDWEEEARRAKRVDRYGAREPSFGISTGGPDCRL